LDSKGKKQELLDRLEALDATPTPASVATPASSPATSAAPKSNGAVKLPLASATAKPAAAVPATKPAPVESKAAVATSTTAVAAAAAAATTPTTPEGKSEPSGEAPKVVSLARPKQDFFSARQSRAQKFGVEVKMSDDEKRNARGARFGVETASLATEGSRKRKVGEDSEKLAARAKKFGLPATATATATDPDKLLKRSKKFGTPVPSGVVDPEEAEKRKARSDRFAKGPGAAQPTAGQPEATKAATPAV